MNILNENYFEDEIFKNLNQTNLTESNFSNSDLQDTIFENTNLAKTNFKEARNYAINPLANNMKKATFSMPEAVVLLELLGIIVDLGKRQK